ncbi:MAG: GspH/FimT family pseudopilin [Verrucomicrobia bacterium]|nr:GspH/FimT family pseudopilin [Verrucomicrobiota bacterium]
MTPPNIHTRKPCRPAFSLVELSVAIAILLTLATAGAQLLGHTGIHTRKASTELITSLIEQARNTAITSRRHVILAIAEPGDIANTDERCRLGIFKVDSWPDSFDGVIRKAVQKGRWRALEAGLTISSGSFDDLDNPLDAPEIALQYGSESKPRSAKVHAIAFNPRGGIVLPASANPVLIRVAAGSYRDGKAIPRHNGISGAVTEQKIKIGRVTARPYQIKE